MKQLIKFILYVIVGLFLFVVLPILNMAVFAKLAWEVYLIIIGAELFIAYLFKMRKGWLKHKLEVKKLKEDHSKGKVEKLDDIGED